MLLLILGTLLVIYYKVTENTTRTKHKMVFPLYRYRQIRIYNSLYYESQFVTFATNNLNEFFFRYSFYFYIYIFVLNSRKY